MLAQRLLKHARRPNVLVLALPRGGVPVGYEVAQALHAPLDVFVVRKLGVPDHDELAMGAIANGGIRVLNGEVVEGLNISEDVIDAVAVRELHELERRERAYRDDRPLPDVQGRTVILVDDGIAIGSTMKAAVEALRQLEVGRIVVAAPTAALSTVRAMQADVDELITVMTPADFASVGQWYEDFSQTTDDEVCKLLDQATQLSNPTKSRRVNRDTTNTQPFPSVKPMTMDLPLDLNWNVPATVGWSGRVPEDDVFFITPPIHPQSLAYFQLREFGWSNPHVASWRPDRGSR